MKIKLEVDIDTSDPADLDTIEQFIELLKDLAAKMKD
jgi:hypothetical protein